MPPASQGPAAYSVVRETPLAPLIRNAEATLVELRRGETVLPMIVPDIRPTFPSPGRCWTTCLESTVVGYVQDMWRERRQPKGLRVAVGNLIFAMFSCGPWRRAVQVGSLPFSTTVRCADSVKMIWELLPALRKEMPDRPFAIRSLLEADLPETLPPDAVKIPARVVYLQDFREGAPPVTSAWKRDVRKLRHSGLLPLEDHDFGPERTDQALELYRLLYRVKYSGRHPDFTPGFMALARQRGWISLRGLADPCSGRLVAFGAEQLSPTTVSTPFLGHDTRMPKNAALYRQICAMLTLGVMERRLMDHSSSGCGEFKRNRSYKPTVEYLVVLPALTGPRRATDRTVLALAGAATRKLGLREMLAAGG